MGKVKATVVSLACLTGAIGSAAAAEIPACNAVFSHASQSNSNGGQIRILSGSQISGSPGNSLATARLDDRAGTSSCGDGPCSASGSPGAAVDFNDFLNNAKTQLRVNSHRTETIAPGDYSQIDIGSEATVYLLPGDYKVKDNISISAYAKLIIQGDGPVRFLAKQRVYIGNGVEFNKGGEAADLLIYARNDIRLYGDADVTAFIYGKESVEIGNDASLTGAVSGKNVYHQYNTRTYHAASQAAAADFDDFCGAGSAPAPTPPDGNPLQGGSCAAIFPDGLQSHAAAGEISFDAKAKLKGNPDSVLATFSLTDHSGGGSCDSQSCSAAGTPATGAASISIPASNNNFSLSSKAKDELPPGNYGNISLGAQSQLSLSPGDYYVDGNFSAGSKSQVTVSGSATARLWIRGNLSLDSQAKLNEDGGADRLLLYAGGNASFGSKAHADAFIYAGGNATLDSQANINGAVSASRITLGSKAQVSYAGDKLADADLGSLCDEAQAPAGYRLLVQQPTLTCEAARVTVQALDTQGNAMQPAAGTRITLSASPAPASGGWSGASGDFSPLDSFSFDGSQSEAPLRFVQLSPGSVSLHVADGSASGELSVAFVDAALGVKETITTQVAGKPSASYSLRAVQRNSESGACEAAIRNSTIPVSFGYHCSDPGSCSSGSRLQVNGQSFGPALGGATTDLNFNSAGEASFSFSYLDAGRIALLASAQVAVEGNASATLQGATLDGIAGTVSNSFLSRPAGLCVRATAAAAACSAQDGSYVNGDGTCDVFTQAGAPFALEVSGRAYGAESESGTAFCDNPLTPNFRLDAIQLTHSLVAPADGVAGGLARSSIDIGSGGTATLSDQAIGEVGVFTLTATPGQYLGDSGLQPSTSALIGRFVPAYLQPSAAIFAPACGAFSFMGQDFGVSYQVLAKSSAGATLGNYRGEFQRLVGGSQSFGARHDAGSVSFLSDRMQGTTPLQAIHVSNGGIVATQVRLSRDGGSADGPYPALNIGIRLVDMDGIATNADLDTTGDAAADMWALGTADIRYGRLLLESKSGPPTQALALPARTQFYNGSEYETFAAGADSCSSLNSGDISLQVRNDASGETTDYAAGVLSGLALGESGSTTGTLAGSLNDPNDMRRLDFSAPGSGNTGVVTLQANSADWLRNLDGSPPSATATFGSGVSGPDRVIYWLEN